MAQPDSSSPQNIWQAVFSSKQYLLEHWGETELLFREHLLVMLSLLILTALGTWLVAALFHRWRMKNLEGEVNHAKGEASSLTSRLQLKDDQIANEHLLRETTEQKQAESAKSIIDQLNKKYAWLEALGQKHNKEIKYNVRIDYEKLSVKPYFHESNPYVIFTISIFNYSIYPLTIEETHGQHFTCEGKPLSEETRLHWPNMPHFKTNTAKPGNPFTFHMIQPLPSSFVDLIKSQKRGSFGAHNISVRFIYKDYTETPQHIDVSFNCQIPLELSDPYKDVVC